MIRIVELTVARIVPNCVTHYIPVLIEELRAILLANSDVPDIIANDVLFGTNCLQERAFGMNLGGNCQGRCQDAESHFEIRYKFAKLLWKDTKHPENEIYRTFFIQPTARPSCSSSLEHAWDGRLSCNCIY